MLALAETQGEVLGVREESGKSREECVCVREREKERDREGQRERERARERERERERARGGLCAAGGSA